MGLSCFLCSATCWDTYTSHFLTFYHLTLCFCINFLQASSINCRYRCLEHSLSLLGSGGDSLRAHKHRYKFTCIQYSKWCVHVSLSIHWLSHCTDGTHTHSSSQSGRHGQWVGQFVISWYRCRACCLCRWCASPPCVRGRTWCCPAASELSAAGRPSAAPPSGSPVIGRSPVTGPSPLPAATACQTSGYHTQTHTHTFNDNLSGITRVSQHSSFTVLDDDSKVSTHALVTSFTH